jgi:cell division protein FtsQ
MSVLVVLALLAVFDRKTQGYLEGSSRFKVGTVNVSGNRYLTDDEVLELAGIDMGQNIFRIRLAQISQRIESHPKVLQATVWRQPPGQLAIKISERRPVALLSLSDHLREVDRFKVILPIDPRASNFDLPFISGLSAHLVACGEPRSSSPVAKSRPFGADGRGETSQGGELRELESGKSSSSEALARAIAIIEHLEDSELLRNISEINVGDPRNLILYLTDGCQVRMGQAPIDEKVSCLQRALQNLQRRSITPDYIDLRFEGKVVVKPK